MCFSFHLVQHTHKLISGVRSLALAQCLIRLKYSKGKVTDSSHLWSLKHAEKRLEGYKRKSNSLHVLHLKLMVVFWVVLCAGWVVFWCSVSYVACPWFEWVTTQACVWACMCTQTHTVRLEWACYRTSDLQLLSPGIGTWFGVCVYICVFILCAAGRTDDSSCASLPTRAALLPGNTDQTAVARRRVKCSLKPLISLSRYSSLPFSDQCILLVDAYH